MDPKIGAQADEEDCEGNRERVEGSNGRRSEGRGPDQAHQQGEEGGRDDLRRAKGAVEDERDQYETEDAGHSDIPRNADHFVIVECGVARDTDLDSAFGK